MLTVVFKVLLPIETILKLPELILRFYLCLHARDKKRTLYYSLTFFYEMVVLYKLKKYNLVLQ